MLRGLAFLLLLQALPTCAAALEGRVVYVADGDTLTVLDDHKRQHKVRLAGIDAPERSQPFGKRAATELASLAKTSASSSNGAKPTATGASSAWCGSHRRTAPSANRPWMWDSH